MSEKELRRALAEADKTITTLQKELTETNREVMALTLDLERRMDDLRALNTMATIVNRAQGVKELLQQALDESLRLVGVEAAGIMLLDEAGDNLVLKAHRGISTRSVEALKQWPLGEGMAGRVAQTGEPLTIDRLEAYPGALRSFLEQERFESIASIPLVGSQGVTGVMNLAAEAAAHFSDSMIVLLQSLGKQIATGIEKLYLHEQTRARAEELRRRTEELRESRERMAEALELNRRLIDASSLGITVYDTSGNCVLANAASGPIIGATRDQLLAQNFRTIASWKRASFLEAAETALTDGEATRQEAHLVSTFGKSVWLDLRFVPFRLGGEPHLLVVTDDVTEQKQLQEQLIRHEKLATLGRLSGSVSHELRNPLGAIKNAAYFLTMVIESPDPDVGEALEILEREVGRSEGVIQGLLDFARSEPPTREDVDVNQIIVETVHSLDVPSQVDVITCLDEEIPLIRGDPNQLIQVFRNIEENGIQAMADGGELVLRSSRLSDGEIEVAISDTGMGIPDHQQDQIFEPLFTTKTQGIGLGLAIVKSLVEGHGGTIEVKSRLAEGSTFTVRLPIGERTPARLSHKGPRVTP